MKKKSQSHIEVIISFLLFITFIILFMAFLNPFQNRNEKNQAFETLQDGIIKKISIEIGKLSIITNDSDSCYEFNPVDYNLMSNIHYKEFRQEQRKYDIYFSEVFESDSAIKKGCYPKNYKIGVFSKEKMVYYDKILELKNIEYNDIKNILGVNMNFNINFRTIDGQDFPELMIEKTIPKGINVLTKEIPIRVINNNGEIKEMVMNLMAW